MYIDWALVGGAFCGGLVMTLLLAARRRPSAAARRGLIAGALFISTLALLLASPFQAASQPEATLAASVETQAMQRQTAAPASSGAVDVPAPLATRAYTPRPFTPPQPTPAAPPPRLRIAALGVDAEVVPVSIHAGQWDMEPLGSEVGRLDTTGARPGDAFAMVLVGHITLTASRRGPFAELQHIPRDGVVSYVAEGVEYVYRVRSVRRLEPEDVKSLYVRDGQVLLLLTCTDFDPERRVYANRLLVEAELLTPSGPLE